MSMIIECSKQLDAITIKQNSNGLLHSLATIRLESTVGTVSSIKVSVITTTYNFNYTKPPKNTIILRLGFKALFFPKKTWPFQRLCIFIQIVFRGQGIIQKLGALSRLKYKGHFTTFRSDVP